MRTVYSHLQRLESVLLVGGVLFVGVALTASLSGKIYSRAAVETFHSSPQIQAAPGQSSSPVDYSLWSRERIDRYKSLLARTLRAPLAVLKIDKIGLEVPVFEGTSSLVLNRGVGRIVGSAKIGEFGNIGIAGHRDGFFRKLKAVTVGDVIGLETNAGTQLYKVDSIVIVEQDDLSALKDDSRAGLTLVTCFPFYFVGGAPQRYIVHATLQGKARASK